MDSFSELDALFAEASFTDGSCDPKWREDCMTSLNITETDDGCEFRLHVGDELTVRLDATPGTGYSWEVSGNGGKVLSQVGEPVYEKVKQPILGGVQKQVFHFCAKLPGVHRLTLEYRRPWEKAGTAMKSFSFTVIVD